MVGIFFFYITSESVKYYLCFLFVLFFFIFDYGLQSCSLLVFKVIESKLEECVLCFIEVGNNVFHYESYC